MHECEERVHDEVAEAFPVEEIPMVLDPTDGLPRPASDDSQYALAAPFTFDHVNCVEDDRVYVEVFGEQFFQLDVRLSKSVVHRSMLADDGHPVEPIYVPKDQVIDLFGCTVFRVDDSERYRKIFGIRDKRDRYILVRPRRERCVHYKRQVFTNDEQPDDSQPGHRIVFRNCTVRRSVGGAYMSLRDEGIYACDYRDPPDPDAVKLYLDDPDARHLRAASHRELVPMFGMCGTAETMDATDAEKEQEEKLDQLMTKAKKG